MRQTAPAILCWMIGIDKQGFIYVYSESLDKRVIFAFQNMVNPHLLSPIGNFLMAVSHQFPNDLAYFIQDVKNCPIVHLPRVVFKNIILSPERWSFDVSSRLESLDSFKTFVRQQMETHCNKQRDRYISQVNRFCKYCCCIGGS